jgi:hypothetical protein
MKKHSGLPLSLSLIILLIAQQILTLQAPAQNLAGAGPVARSAQAYQGQSLAPSNNVTRKATDSQIFDAVTLDYEHLPFPAGTVIPLFGIKGGRVGSPEQGCPSIHYHSDPNLPSVRICRSVNAEGIRSAIIVEEGPYRDQNPQGCGHGRVEKKQAALEITVEGPSMAARATTATYRAKVKNTGEVDFDRGSVRVILAFDGVMFPFPNFFPLNAALRPGQEEDILVPLDLKAFEEDPDLGVGPFSVLEVDMTALGFLKDCREDVPQIGASVKLTTNVIDAGTGPAPDLKREFGFDFDSDDKRFKVMPVSDGKTVTGLALFKDGGLSFFRSDLRGGFTAGIGPVIQGRVDNGIVEDLDRDGWSDIIAVNNQSRSLSAFLQSGNGVFRPARSFVTGIDFARLISADIDGDDAPDIVGADSSGMMQVMKGDGQGGFTALPTWSPGLNRIDVLARGNFDGDAFDDVLVGANDPSGGSQLGVFHGSQDGILVFSQFFTFAGSYLRVATADLDGDGSDEIITAFGNSSLIDILDSGSGAVIISIQSAGANPVFVVAGDINGEGGFDLAVADRASNLVSIFLGDGRGNFFFAGIIPTPRPAGIILGDFNNAVVANGLDFLVFRKRDLQFRDSLQTAEADDDSAGVTVFLNGAEPVARPVVEQVDRRGKHLIVTCPGCAPGSKVLVDGVQKKSIAEPDGKLRAKKAAKKIKAGQTAVVQVESEGRFSEWFIFRQPD